MASYYGKNFTKTRATPPQAIDGGEYGGRRRVITDSIDTTTAMTTGDLIFLGKLMPGERVLDGVVFFGTHGASRTIKLGDVANDARLFAAIDISSAGSSRALAASGFRYKNTTNAPIDLYGTLAGGTLAALTDGISWALDTVRD